MTSIIIALWERGETIKRACSKNMHAPRHGRGGGIGETWAPDPNYKGKALQLQFTVEDDQAIRLNPNYTLALRNRGAAYLGRDQPDTRNQAPQDQN
jgi:hypothetical protein